MRLIAGHRNREALIPAHSSLSRRQREERHRTSILLAMLVFIGGVLGILLTLIAPCDKPVVTVYMHRDCVSCIRWMKHLDARGFRTQIGSEADWPAVRAQFNVMPGFESSHTAVVNGFFIEGPVPARDIHQALRWREAYHLRGLILPGVPRGSPGNESALPEPYTVFFVRQGGITHPFAVHDHDFWIGGSS
jgi:hypothetical protein